MKSKIRKRKGQQKMKCIKARWRKRWGSEEREGYKDEVKEPVGI